MTNSEREALFHRVVMPEVDYLGQYARKLTRHRHDAEDLIQDTLLLAYRAMHRFDPEREPEARHWLSVIMRNRFRQIIDAKKALKRIPQEVELIEEDWAEFYRAEPSAEDKYLTQELLEGIISHLKPHVREFFYYHDILGYPYEAIAQQRGLDKHFVRDSTARGLRSFRKTLEAE